MTELSDELLVAYVDGQLAPRQAQAVGKVLEQDDVLAKRVAALKNAHKRLEAAFDAILAGEEAELASHPVPQARGFFVSWSALAQATLATAGMVLAFIMLLAGLGWPLSMPEFAFRQPAAVDMEPVGSVPRDWQEEVARAQALIGRDSLELGLDSQANAELVRFQLARAVGPNLLVPDLAAQGLSFKRAQLLRFDAEPVAQLIYLGASGAPIALYAKAGEGSATPRFKRYGEIGGVDWSQDGIVYLLAGEFDEASLLRLAQAIGQTRNAAADVAPEPAADAAPEPAPRGPPLPKHKPKS
jgi:anti-sigma factor RsiW